MARTYDAIVLGTGGVGSAALLHLAQRGLSVLGIDRFPPGHDHGSSHGHSRIIRQAYFEHSDYVPLLRAAYALWDALERAHRQKLFHRVGLLEVGPADGHVVPGVLRSAAAYGLDVETLARREAEQRFPGFVFPADSQIVFERNAGFLLVEDCVRAHAAQAQHHGAELAIAAVREWSASANSVCVKTEGGEYHAGRLVITAGPWAQQMLTNLGLPLRVLRKHLHWYTSNCEVYRSELGCPGYFFETGSGFFYGFPQFDRRGVKVAEHGSAGEEVADPLAATRDEDPTDRARVDGFITQHMPLLGLSHSDHAICFYTMTPDEHFIVDHVPGCSHVAFASGLSGHGFKFTSVLGRVLAELVTEGRTSLPIGFLSLARLR